MTPSERPWFIRKARPLLVAGVGLVAIAALGVVLLVERTGDAETWVAHTVEVREAAQHLLLDVVQAESGARGFVLSGDEQYLARYKTAEPDIAVTFNRLRALTVDNATEQKRLADLKPLIDEKLSRIRQSIDLVRSGQHGELQQRIQSDRGEDLMNLITAGIVEMQDAEHILLTTRQAAYDMLQRWLVALIALSLAGAIAVAIGLAFGTQYYIRRLRERTNQLQAEAALRLRTEETLRQAQKLEAVGQLTGGIAHDFNNLLTIIIGNLDTLKRRLVAVVAGETPPGQNLVGLVDVATQGAQSAARLTHRLLAYARRQPLEPVRCDLNRLVSSMSELLRRTLGEPIHIETVLAGGLWPTFADVNQLENALLNLAINARDAMPDGGRLTIETANIFLDDAYAARFGDVRSGQYVLLSVSDTGTGIPPELMDKVFEPFFTTKGHGEGSGLGLAMVHGFVKQSGGHVRLYSEVGHGTSVNMYLPRMHEEEGAAVPAERTVASATATFAARPGEAVLIVEDNAGVRQYASDALADLGYRVYQASDAASAIAIAGGNARIDLLFSDVVLPGGMNGRELAARIAQRRPGIGLLFTTGYTRNAIVHQGRLDADVNLVSKPYTQRDLARKVREILDARPSA
jgi:signal transduction histidine kinase/CheY-like chemotaxis protein